MKYVIEYQIRTAGLTHDQNLANQDALLKAVGKETPEDGLTLGPLRGEPLRALPILRDPATGAGSRSTARSCTPRARRRAADQPSTAPRGARRPRQVRRNRWRIHAARGALHCRSDDNVHQLRRSGDDPFRSGAVQRFDDRG